MFAMNFKMFLSLMMLLAVIMMSGCSFVELSLLKYENRKIAIPEKVALAKSSVALANTTNIKRDEEADIRVLDATLVTGVISLLKAIYSQFNSANDINKEVVEIKEFSVFSIKVGDNDKKTSAVVSDKGDITAEFVD